MGGVFCGVVLRVSGCDWLLLMIEAIACGLAAAAAATATA